jgi:isopentenyl diphosphate isomerase/L-lactate dehydrogenase-like FMN-dependent dehydrogenase
MNAASLQRCAYSIGALRELARQRLPRVLFDMVDGGAGDEITLRRNEAALAELFFLPKLLNGAPDRIQTIELFGHQLTSPVIIGPTGLAGLLWPQAEIAAARAAGRFGTIYTTSHASTSTIEEIGAAGSGVKWMQVFLYKDRGITAEFAARAKQAGYQGLVLTVDNQVLAGRDRDNRNGMAFPLRMTARNALDLMLHPRWLARMTGRPVPTFVNYGGHASAGAFGKLMAEQLDPAVSWKDVQWLRDYWQGRLLIKGLLDAGEAREAQRRGADAIIVSNHGGRQLDGAIASIDALPAIVEAVGAQLPVLVDGGFRRGVDVIKALALGARAVLIGRPHLWGVACGGEAGVDRVLEIFRTEIDRALALGGWNSVAKLDDALLHKTRGVD